MYLLRDCMASANLCGSMTWAQKKILFMRTFVLALRVSGPFSIALFDNICSIIASGDAVAVLDLHALKTSRNVIRGDGTRKAMSEDPKEHPDPRLLERFMRNETSGEERRWIVRHLLAGCARCGEVTRRIWALAD